VENLLLIFVASQTHLEFAGYDFFAVYLFLNCCHFRAAFRDGKRFLGKFLPNLVSVKQVLSKDD